MEYWNKTIVLENLIKDGIISLDRGRVISSIDLMKYPGDFPVYSSSAQKNGYFGSFDLYDFDEELITWSVDGGGYFFYRPKHKFSVTNVSGIMRITKSDKYDYKFLYYLLAYQHKNQIFDYVDKAHPSVIKKRYFIPEIDKSVQTQIATILSKVDEAITQTEQLIAKYTRIKTGLMQDLLTKGIDENGNIRSEETHEFKDSPLGRIPKEWECEKLERYGSFSKGSTISKSLLSDNGVNCILYGELYTKYDIYATEIFSKVPFEFVREKQPLKYGDILFAGSGETHEDIGKCITFIGHKPTYAGGDIVIFRSKHFNPIFLSMLLNSFKLNIQKSALGQGSSVIHIYPNHLKMLDVIFPDKVEQNRIAEIILKNEMYINDLETNLSKLYSLKTGLMQDLLSGKVRVNHLIKETASV